MRSDVMLCALKIDFFMSSKNANGITVKRVGLFSSLCFFLSYAKYLFRLRPNALLLLELS